MQRQLELKTEIGLLQGLPPFSEALRGVEHPAMRQLPDRTFVHLNEVLFDSGARRWLCWAKFTTGLPWRHWASASRTAAHIFGLKSYRPSDHPLYRDACQVISAAMPTDFRELGASDDARLAMGGGAAPARPHDARAPRMSCTNPEVASRLSAAGYVPATRFSLEEGGGAEGPWSSRGGRGVTLEGGGRACRL